MNFTNILDNSINITNAFPPGFNSFIDGFCDATYLFYTFVLRHQVLAVINIAVISVNLFFLWTFGKRKSKKVHTLTSIHSDRSSTYNQFLKKLKAKTQKSSPIQQKYPCRSTKQYEKQLTRPLSRVPKRSPEAFNLIRPFSCKIGCSCCSSQLESSSEDVEETLDEITWGFDTSPLSSQCLVAMDSAGNCLKDIYLKTGPAKTFLKVQSPLTKCPKLQQRAGGCRRSRITSDRVGSKRMAPAGQVNVNDSGDRRNPVRVSKARSRTRSPKRQVRARCAVQSRLVHSESSPDKSWPKRAVALGQASRKGKTVKKCPLKTVVRKTWDRDISTDSDVELKQPESLHRKKQPSSECSDPAGTRSETSLVCKRDSWIWFSPETKASDDDFFTRQNKFKSEDPRVAELAAEIRRQEEMNKSIEREAESLIESSSQSHKYTPHKWTKTTSVAPISRLKGRGRGKRCPLNSRSITKKHTSSRLQIFSTKQCAEKCYKKSTTKHSTPILSHVSPFPKYRFPEVSPKCSPSDSVTMLCSDKESKTMLHGDSTTATSSPFNVRIPLAPDSHYEAGNVAGVHGVENRGAGRRQFNNCVPMSHREMHLLVKNPRSHDHFGQCKPSAGEVRAKGWPEMTLDEEDQERGLSPGPVDKASQTHLPPKTGNAYLSTINNSTNESHHIERQYSPSSHPPDIFSLHMSTSRTNSDALDSKHGPPSRKSPMFIFSTGESESESILRDKSGQEASFRQVILHKEVNTAVHQLLFDTEQSSSSMSPSSMNRANVNVTLQQLMAKEKSPVFIPRLCRDDASCLSMWSTTSTVKMRGPSQNQTSKRTNIYNPDYYLGKRARAKKADEKPVPSSPSRWKKTDPLWPYTVSTRLYSPKQSTPSPARKANVSKEGSPRKSSPQKPKRPRQTIRMGSGKGDQCYTVHKAEPKPWGRYAKSTLNRRFSSPDLRHHTSLLKSACQEPSAKCAGKSKMNKISSATLFSRCVVTKVQGNDINKEGTPKIKNFLNTCNAVNDNGRQVKPPIENKSLGSESSSQPACAKGSPKCSSSNDTVLKRSSDDTQKVVTYSDTYWAKKVSFRREKRSTASSSTSCMTKSPQLTFVKTEAIESASPPQNDDKESRGSVEVGKASEASQLLPGSTNNSSSNDPYQHAGSIRSPKLQLVDDAAKFVFVTDKKMPCNNYNVEHIFPQHERIICGNSKTRRTKTPAFGKKTDFFPKRFSVKPSKATTSNLKNISLVLKRINGFQDKAAGPAHREHGQATKENRENWDREEDSYKGNSQFSRLRSHVVACVNSGVNSEKLEIASRPTLPPPRLVDFERVCDEQQPGSNPDSGYEESFSDKSHFVQPDSPRSTRHPGTVDVQLKVSSSGWGRSFVHTPSATSCSLNSEFLQSISPGSHFINPERAISGISSEAAERDFLDSVEETYTKSNFSHLQNYYESHVDKIKPDKNKLRCEQLEKYSAHAEPFVSSLGVTSFDDNVEHPHCLPSSTTTTQVNKYQGNSEHSETVYKNSLDKTRHLTDNAQKMTKPRNGFQKTTVGGDRTVKNMDPFLLDCSLSSCLARLQCSVATSSNISDLVAALGSPSASPVSERLEDVSRSTTDDIRLLESLNCTPLPPGSGRASQLDSTFERSLLSDSNSDLAFSDSLALELNAAESTRDNKASPRSRYSTSTWKHDTLQKTRVRRTAESANPPCVRKCTFIKNGQELPSEGHKCSERSLEQPAVHGHTELKENKSRRPRSDTDKKYSDTDSSRERIPVRSVAFAELLRRF